jgi:4-diphosphocytidyl-2-C-methyl-D-erythritol kinase
MDLTLRAAHALKAATGCTLGAHIGVLKRIPAQAGMGGGSSDAATALLALNRLWGLDLPRSALETIGLQLGADIPFFLRGNNAWVEGIGETITPLEKAHQLPQARFAVVKPAAGLETKLIFSSPNLKRDSDSATILGFAAEHFDFGRNDLQPVAQAICPEVTQAIEWLQDRGLQARMTGSGSAVFARMSHEVDLSNAPEGWQVKACENLMIHPLAGWASDEN